MLTRLSHQEIEKAIKIAEVLCIKYEAVRLWPYLCPAGVATIGIGATFYQDGRKVTLLDRRITEAEALALLRFHLRAVFLPGVLKLCPGVDSAERLAVLLDFAFNLGVGRLRTSTLRKRVAAENWDMVPTELRKWVRAAGKVLRGLVRRRESEITLL